MKAITACSVFCLFFMLSLALALFPGCSGETGPQGEMGYPGNNGNANVETFSIVVADTAWVVNAQFPWELDYSQSFPAGDTTTGAMECFFSVDDTNWIQLPWTTTGKPPLFQQNWIFNSSALQISWNNVSDTNSAIVPPDTSYFNIVLIPPLLMANNPKVNWNNAEQVAQIPKVSKAMKKTMKHIVTNPDAISKVLRALYQRPIPPPCPSF